MWMALWEQGLPLLQWPVVLAACTLATISDVSQRRIPNILTFPMLLLGMICSVSTAGLAGLADSAVACFMLSAPYVVLFVFAGGGAGDAKLMGAIGAWLGLVNSIVVLFCVSLAAIAIGLAIVIVRKRMRATAINIGNTCYRWFMILAGVKGQPSLATDSQRQTMPYALAMTTGTCIAAIGILIWRLQH